MPDDLLKNLNDKQKEAVLKTEGPVLIIAGPGSGKTRALTHRVAYLIKGKKIPPFNILAVTFTNKAASEMRERIVRLLGTKRFLDLPTIGTFHAVCVQILRKHLHLFGLENNFTIYDKADQLALMKQIMRDQNIDETQWNPRSILAHIGSAKNVLMDYEEYLLRAHNYFTQKVGELYKIYQKQLAKNQALDFDDLLMKTVELFKKYPKILREYQEKFKYILVDEYQDTNHAQYVLTKLLASKYRNLCVVGDDWQSIYMFRGANMQNILDFVKDYPEAKVVKLEQNYRSTPVILDAAHHVIVKNKQRTQKKMWTPKKGGPKIRVWVARNEREEGELIVEEIEEMVRQNECPSYRDFVVLYRTNAQSRALEEVFMRYGMPYKIVGGVRFYERKEIKDLLAYLRVIQNPRDSISLLRILNVPPRKIGPKTLGILQNYVQKTGLPLFEVMEKSEELGKYLSEEKIRDLKKFVKLISELQELSFEFPAAGVIKQVLIQTKYKNFLLDGTPEGEARFENAQELISVATKYSKLEPRVSLAVFLEEVSLIADIDAWEEKDNAVTLMTLHSAKGLEFPCAFICGLEEGILPHARSLLDPQELEEERRLLYVGMTRAKDDLFLSYTEQRLLYGEVKNSAPSQFLFDIPEKLIERNVAPFESLRYPRTTDFGKRPIPIEEIED